jgi:hypothetical protein
MKLFQKQQHQQDLKKANQTAHPRAKNKEFLIKTRDFSKIAGFLCAFFVKNSNFDEKQTADSAVLT